MASLAKPGGNITGLSLCDPELIGKRVELLKEAYPTLTRIVFLHEPNIYSSSQNAAIREVLRKATSFKRLRLSIHDVRNPHDVLSFTKSFIPKAGDGLVVLHGRILLSHRESVADFAFRKKPPAMYSASIFVEVGGLMFYGSPYKDLYSYAAQVVSKVLHGTKPSDIPVEQPYRYQLLVNSRVANSLPIRMATAIQLVAEPYEASSASPHPAPR